MAVASSSATETDAGIDDMLAHLELNEDELDDVVIDVEKSKVYHDAARWLAIGKVPTNRNFSADALFEKMKNIWNLSREPNCREAGENLFIFQMYCLGDWKKVVQQGPWIFRGFGLLIEDYDGLSAPEDFVFTGMHVWAQIHGIPELYRKVDVVDDLARKIGQVKEVQLAPKLFFEGNYVRIRVRINIEKALMRVVSLTLPEGKKRLMVKYEKVPFFCKRCGFLGHDHEECGDGVWEDKQLQFGSWMLATRRANQPTPEARGFTPRTPARGGFAGRSGGFPSGVFRKRTSEDASLDKESDLGDTGLSPMKTSPSETGIEGSEGAKDVTDTSGKTSMDASLEVQMSDILENPPLEGVGTNNGCIDPPLPPPYLDPRDRSKLRKTRETSNILATSSASSEEVRRAQ
jgi:hypothetical protein